MASDEKSDEKDWNMRNDEDDDPSDPTDPSQLLHYFQSLVPGWWIP